MADADLAVGDVLECRFEGTILGNRWNNVIHLAITTAPTNPDEIYENLSALADSMHTAFFNAVSPNLVTTWVLNLTRIKRIRPTPSVFAFFADAMTGAVTGEVDEPDDAIVCRLYTSQAGRSRQGRIFIAGIPDAEVSIGLLSSTVADELAADLGVFFVGPITGSNGLTVSCYVWSPKLSNDGDPLTLAAYPVKRVFIDRVVRRMTRRDWNDPVLVMGEGP